MALFGANNSPTTRYNGLRTSEAVLGTTLPIVLGQQRLSWKLLWYGDFRSAKAKQQGGSGLGKGGTNYVYTASVAGAVCMGPCANFLGVWDSIGKYATNTYSETFTVGAGANPTYNPVNQDIFRQDLGAGVDASYSFDANDYGSPGTVVYSGTQVVPLEFTANLTPDPGQYTVDPGTNTYIFNSSQTGQVATVHYVAFRYEIQESELAVVPAGGSHQVTVQYQSEYQFDSGVTYYPSGVAFHAVSGTPTIAGTYNPNGGNYRFSAPDVGQGITINYVYKDVNTDVNAPSTLNLTFFSGTLGQTPWSYLTSKFPGAAIGYSEIAYVASSGIYLGYSPVLPQLNFEILGPYSFGKGIPDCNPADAIFGLLTNPEYKYVFPTANIDSSLLGTWDIQGSVTSGTFTANEQIVQDTTHAKATLIGTVTGANNLVMSEPIGPADKTHTWVGQTSSAVYTPTTSPYSSSAKAQWTANNFFISAILDSQTSLMSTISDWCEAGQVYISYDEGKLKFIPLSDTTSIANGTTYVPPTQPVVDLDDNDFVIDGKDRDPITLEQTPWQNRWNRVNIRWSVRSNDYNEDILQIQDEASVQQYGLMSESSQGYDFICTENAAQFAANMRLQRLSAIYTTYSFTLKSNFAFLSPGDVITITDGLLGTSGNMFGRTPVRITKMTDDPEKGISIEAENFPWSVGASLLYNKQAQIPSNTNDGPQENPGDTIPLIFTVPARASVFSSNVIYIFINGQNVNWGGSQIFVSFNGTDYSFYGQYDNPARIGVTVNDFPSHVDPDDDDTLTVNMQQSEATLQGVTLADRDALVTLSAILSPGVSFDDEALATIGVNLGTSTSTGDPGSVGPTLVTSGTSTPLPGTGGVTPGVAWSNPQNVTGSSGYATAAVSYPVLSNTASQYLDCLNPALNVPTFGVGNITGIQVDFTSYISAFTPGPKPNKNMSLVAQLIFNGSVIGDGKVIWAVDVFGDGGPTTPTAFTLGSQFDSWNLSPGQISAEIVNSSSFGIRIFGGIGDHTSPDPTAVFDVNDVQFTLYWAAGGAALPWTNPENVGSTGSFATVPLVQAAPVSQWLAATGFDFNLPFGFLLGGIQVVINAFTGLGFTTTLNVSLMYKGQRIGVAKSVSISHTSSDVTFGSPIDTWGDLSLFTPDVINDPTFGVAFYVSGHGSVATDTVSANNVRIQIFGSSNNNLELISYENADLTGLNTYDLSSFRRGVYGTFPVDHPIGSAFVRIDQATIKYTIDPTYMGSTIFFKFLSFNAYGNQLQSLADVTAYELVLDNLATGAIDPATGALVTGTPNFNVNQMDVAISAVHGSFGIQNIPAGYTLVGQANQSTGVPQWTPIITGGGGSGSVYNLFVISASTNITVAAWDLLICDTASGGFTVTLPSAAANPNVAIGVKKASGSANTNAITIARTGSDTIFTEASVTSLQMQTEGDCLYFASDGISKWYVYAGFLMPVNDMYIYIPPVAGTYGTSQELYFSEPVRSITFPLNLSGTHAGCRNAPTGNIQVTIQKNGSSIGTINIASGATTATYTFSSAVTFNGSTDTFTLIAPGTPDRTLAGFWVNFYVGRVI